MKTVAGGKGLGIISTNRLLPVYETKETWWRIDYEFTSQDYDIVSLMLYYLKCY